jgi:hypothetical protein
MSSGDSLYFYTDGGGQQLLFGAGIELWYMKYIMVKYVI